MLVTCPSCNAPYDDEFRWTMCPHNPLDVAHDAPYCREHDLFNCTMPYHHAGAQVRLPTGDTGVVQSALRFRVGLDETIEFMNSLLEIDRAGVSRLFLTQCTSKLAEHPTVQCRQDADAGYSVSALGVLNGLFGTYPDGWGPIAAVVDPDTQQIAEFVRTPSRRPGSGTVEQAARSFDGVLPKSEPS